mgnify:FL=1
MDTVTYPSDVVQQECASHWLTLKVDVSVRGDLTSTCGVHGIPASLALDSSARVLGEILGFVEADAFASQLLRLRPH